MRSAATLLAAASLLLTGLSGCSSDPAQGYSFTPTHAQNIRTVSVPMFVNETYDAGIEAEFTDALVKEIQRTTRWAVVSDRAADATISGVLTGSELQRLSVRRNTGYVQEMANRVTADFEFRDNRSGKVILERRGFEAVDTFVAARPTGEPIDVARSGAVQRLAKDIVAELRSGW